MDDFYSDFLYARPSFLEGMARVMDIGGALNEYNNFLSDEDADFVALWMDWSARRTGYARRHEYVRVGRSGRFGTGRLS